jgi:hypothetical protein
MDAIAKRRSIVAPIDFVLPDLEDDFAAHVG